MKSMLDARIFIQIAAYRDLELVPTVKDAIAQAAKLERLSFGICWQYADSELYYVELLKDIPNCRVESIPAKQSQGLGWARHKTQQLWDSEEYSLQIDAHMRFAPRWDEQLIEMLAQCPSEKPLLSSYPPAYIPPRHLVSHNATRIRPKFFLKSGDLRQQAYDDLSKFEAPQSGMLIAGGFSFSRAEVIQEVPQDPNIYFTDEVPYGVRLWTHGWDVYNPHKPVCWHFYNSGETRVLNWSDNPTWNKRQKRTESYIRQLLGMEPQVIDFGEYGLGEVRSLAELERRLNINFAKFMIGGETKLNTIQRDRQAKKVGINHKLRERDILLYCTQPQHQLSGEEEWKAILTGRLDWKYLIGLAIKHGVFPLLFQRLQALDILADLPKHTQQELKQEYRSHIIRNSNYEQELASLVQLLDTHQISVLAYKGPSLAIAAYGDLLARQFSDLDLLVAPEYFEEAKNILTKVGYRLLTPHTDHAFDLVLRNHQSRMAIDLHRAAVPSFYGFSCRFEDLLENAHSLQLVDQTVMMPSPEDLLLLLSIHGLKDRWRKLIWLRDLYEIIHSTPDLDWDYIWWRSHQLGVKRALQLGLKFSAQILDWELPKSVQAQSDYDLTWHLQYLNNQLFEVQNKPVSFKTIKEDIRLDLQIRERWRDRFTYILKRIFAPSWRDQNLVKLPKSFSFIYWFIRPFYVVTRIFSS
ncbi:hypothetical protein Lepto7376_3465 [[Leptolyngbya] sp. PCC 7376]|uniref:GlcNAc-transferase family protein n=1 Tax=[Leptolyngbya] sp. PCC 7376 TaxID=111781 RepID=UPI00029F0E3B|nr:GlcNAc-transferase family protein [[Leptolyngbya] sp. PCC 7376]AFY39668.1 hypothetical protein Lepto7376_3465 [[Leptolyngbya] sp. PCC 7376]